MDPIDLRKFLGAVCNHEHQGGSFVMPRGICGAPADYLVLDGEVPVLACPRHLLDSIEEVVGTSYLTVDSQPLGIIRLRETEDD